MSWFKSKESTFNDKHVMQMSETKEFYNGDYIQVFEYRLFANSKSKMEKIIEEFKEIHYCEIIHDIEIHRNIDNPTNYFVADIITRTVPINNIAKQEQLIEAQIEPTPALTANFGESSRILEID